MVHCTKVTWTFELVLALAPLVPVSAVAATIVMDGDTIDIDGVRIRIVQIDTPETFRRRCENELALSLKAKERLRGCSTAALFRENIMKDSVMKFMIPIAISMALLAPSVSWPGRYPAAAERPVSRTSNHRCHPPAKKRAAELTRRVSEEAQANYPESPTYPRNDDEAEVRGM